MQLQAGTACADMTGLTVSPANGPQAWLIDDGARLHLQHGPIDLLIAAKGSAPQVKAAYRQATLAFQSVLPQLVAELPELRTVLPSSSIPGNKFNGVVARHMYLAAFPFVSHAVTPMVAVAGAVADHVLGAMLKNRQLQRVSVNNGGDIALYLAPGSSFRVGICERPDSESHDSIITLSAADEVGGIATSGWRGRSHSLGVADAVTVLACTAAMADAAATVIANAIDVPHSPHIQRQPACELNPDSDLGRRLVTVDVSFLSSLECSTALAAGRRVAEQMCREKLINSAYLKLQGRSDVVTQNSRFTKPRIPGDLQKKTLKTENDAGQLRWHFGTKKCEFSHFISPLSTASN